MKFCNLTVLLLALSSAVQGDTLQPQSSLRKKGKDAETNEMDDVLSKTKDKVVGSMHRRATSTMIKVKALNDGSSIGSQSYSMTRCNVLSQRRVKNIPLGSHIFLTGVRQVTFGERFDGMEQIIPTGTISLSDELIGLPTSPLNLVANFNERENLFIEPYRATNSRRTGIQIKGRGPTGVNGPGSISLLFAYDKKKVDMSFKANGAHSVRLMFYDREGNALGNMEVDIEHETEETYDYQFISTNNETETESRGNIAGISIVPKGSALDWHKFSLVGLCFDNM